MTNPPPMTREELLELAPLDALGLLGDYEAALFTRSFHHAPVTVQDEVRDLQASFAGDETLIMAASAEYSEAPVLPDSLKSRVLAGVMQSVEFESGGLAPLATIGRNAYAGVGRATDARVRHGRHHGRHARSWWRGATLWRAACFVLAGVVSSLIWSNAQLRQEQGDLQDMMISHWNEVDLINALGGVPQVAALSAKTTTHTYLLPEGIRDSANPTPAMSFAVLGMTEDGDGVLLVAGLKGLGVELVGFDAAMNKVTSEKIDVSERLPATSVNLEGLGIAAATVTQWIIQMPDGTCLLTTS